MSGGFATERDEKLFNQGYEKGVRDMWEVAKANCYSCTMEHGFDNNGNCDINTCPIAQKLLKGVK